MFCRLSVSLRIHSTLIPKARSVSAMAQVEWKGLAMKSKGEPLDVLDLIDLPVAKPGPNQVLVQMIAAPVNPRWAIPSLHSCAILNVVYPLAPTVRVHTHMQSEIRQKRLSRFAVEVTQS
jgi:hypothetical protein